MEKYIIGGRGTGKTRKMLEWAKENNAVVVCKNPIAMENKAHNYGIAGLRFVGYDEIGYDRDDFIDKKIAIHNLRDFIFYYHRIFLDSFTLIDE